MVIKESFLFVHTDKDTHFTEQLLPYASEYENIVISDAGVGSVPCWVESIRLWSTQNLPWMLSFHRTDNTAPGTDSTADYDQNTMIEFWPFTAADGYASASGYVYAVSGLKIPYRDEDSTAELHVALHNRHATTWKSDVASAYVQVTFGLRAAV